MKSPVLTICMPQPDSPAFHQMSDGSATKADETPVQSAYHGVRPVAASQAASAIRFSAFGHSAEPPAASALSADGTVGALPDSWLAPIEK